MKKTVEMFVLGPVRYGLAARDGNSIKKTTCTVGSKYYTDAAGRKFPIDDVKTDVNGNPYRKNYVPGYGSEYLLFETAQAALDFAEASRSVLELRQTLPYMDHMLSLSEIKQILAITEAAVARHDNQKQGV